jgi:hypothetical protein
MTRPLDVLLLENRPGVGLAEQAALEDAGHHVHRCHELGDDEFPCNGMVPGRVCPMDGPIDVTLLVRRGVSPRPTPFEDGVRCASRRDVPIVEHGSDALDPFAPWVAHRVGLGESVVTECVLAADRANDPLRTVMLERIRPVLAAAGIDPGGVACDLDRDGPTIEAHVTLPEPPDRRLEQALAVRVLDAIRASGRTYGHVGVQVHTASS